MEKILFIDAYDSFSNNIVSLLRVTLAVEVQLIHIDDSRFVLNDDAFSQYIGQFDAVVVGPGPGHPENIKDTGLIDRIWKLSDEHVLPVLGICLGFQSLCLNFGSKVTRLNQPRHGRVTQVIHSGTDIFTGTGKIFATQYHSLRVDIERGEDDGAGTSLWTPPESCSDIRPLAWDLNDTDNGTILMAARHCSLPFWGVQYHPESICTCDEGRRLVENWWTAACAWNRSRRRAPPTNKERCNGLPFQHKTPLRSPGGPGHRHAEYPNPENRVCWRQLQLPNATDVVQIAELLQSDPNLHSPIILESGQRDGKQVNPETGRFSIIGFHDSSSAHIRYSTSNHTLIVISKGVSKSQVAPIADVYRYLDSIMKTVAATDGPEDVPFWGGLVGYISYEAGLEGIDLSSANCYDDRPDVWFIMIERSVVIDHATGVLFMQTIREDDELWLSSVEKALVAHPEPSVCRVAKSNRQSQCPGHILSAPVRSDYCSKIRDCQAELRAGCSYELCLTDQTLVSSSVDPWSLYRRLRQLNPAPFGAYFHFYGHDRDGASKVQSLDVVSSSPERFLSWSREGKHQFRPIKGTLKKGPGVDRSTAERVLGSPKEQAENLMIVDLIRHDLNGVARTGTVRVPKLMTIEEYETVFQLVSVIEGDLEPQHSGVAALAASLPPGSMTGAPKKRSCELLQGIEGPSSVRGLYSGVIGYLDVGGGGDFSVVIRTAFKWDDGEWRIGAGGAITVLSEEEAEFEEMATKRESPLRAIDVTLRDQGL